MSSGDPVIDSHVAVRFRSERQRLGMTHSEVAKEAGYSRNSVVSWEKGASIPASVLGVMAPHGFDVQFICTGVRSSNAAALGTGDNPTLEGDEWKLVRRFRALGDQQQTQALAMLEVLGAGLSIGSGNTVIVKGDGKRVAGGNYNDNRIAKPKRGDK